MEKILYCPTSCPYLGKNGCRVACGNEEIECPVMAGVLVGENTADEERTQNGEKRKRASRYNTA